MQSVVRIVGRLVLLAIALFLSLLLVVLDGSTGATQGPNWAVPLLVVVWGAVAYLAHLRSRWARRRSVAGRTRSARGLSRDVVGEAVVRGGAAALAGVAAGAVALTLADAPVVPLVSSVVLGAVVGVVASDILRRLGWSE